MSIHEFLKHVKRRQNAKTSSSEVEAAGEEREKPISCRKIRNYARLFQARHFIFIA
jgi:hypothetical protein